MHEIAGEQEVRVPALTVSLACCALKHLDDGAEVPEATLQIGAYDQPTAVR
jgi:hypothetical protein